eukprot:756034-Hanusia_phi.AAC.1
MTSVFGYAEGMRSDFWRNCIGSDVKHGYTEPLRVMFEPPDGYTGMRKRQFDLPVTQTHTGGNDIGQGRGGTMREWWRTGAVEDRTCSS